MNQRAITQIILAVIGVPVLITIGAWSATDPFLAGTSALVVVGIVVLAQLGAKCWLLIPFFAAFTGSLNILPGNFAPRDLAVGLVAFILPFLWVLQRFPVRFRFTGLEMSLLVVLVLLGQAYLRNPVGLSIFGSSVIGGRPYFEIAVSTVAFVILSVQLVDFKSVRLMIFGNFTGSIIIAIFETVVGLFPILSYYVGGIYQSGTSSIALKEYFGGGVNPNQGTGRMFAIGKFSKPIMNLILSFRAPIGILEPRNFGFLFLAVFAGVCILLSGFRTGVAGYGALILVSAFLHRKGIQVVVMGLIGVPLIAAVLVLQGSVLELPLAAQRAMSFLPADWDHRAVRDAEGSSEWRFEMWEEALTSDRYIRNKWLGDGFGFTAQELAYQQELMVRGMRPEDMQDYFLMTGTYHSGPVETIKRIGYIGFIALVIVMIVFLKKSISLVNRTRGTPYFPYAMFVALPLVYLPFKFVLIYGAFQTAVSGLLLAGGMIRLIENSFDRWRNSRMEPNADQALESS